MPDLAAGLRVAVLGPVALRAGGALVDPAGMNARAVIAALALAAPAPCGVDALTDAVWGDDPPHNPRAALQTLVSRLRALAGADAVRSATGGYALGAAGDEVDLTRARRLRTAAAAPGLDERSRLAHADEALALWRGEPGADLGEAPVAADLAREAAVLRDDLVAMRARALVGLGRANEAIADLAEIVAARPYDETAALGLIDAMDAAGRAPEALAAFAALRARLRDDLGAAPSALAVERNARLLREDDDRATPRVRIGLQAAPNALIGRDDDLAAVAGLLTRSRLVTILGPGGLGKTRLAHAVGAASEAPVVVVVPLAGVRTDAGVLPAIAATLGVSESTAAGRLTDAALRLDLRTRVVSQLAEHPTVLVLDNCEQIVAGVATVVADALAAAGRLRVLATSRTPLQVAAESVYSLEPLPVEGGANAPAVRLFLERARAVRPGADLPLEVVGRLCAHLDGLPLAVELAAARVRTMTPAQIEEKLTDRFALLTGGDRTAPDRHRTLEAVIAWSWDLLDSRAQDAFATLAVLPAGFGAESAAALLGEPPEDLLDRLVAQSLLVVVEDDATGALRFRMLETIREYGLSRLAAGRAGGTQAALERLDLWAVEFCTARVVHAFDPAEHRRILAEHDNLVAALRRAVERGDNATVVVLVAVLGQTWMISGALSELMGFLPGAFAAAGSVAAGAVPPEAHVAVLLAAVLMGRLGGPDAGVLRLIARLRRVLRDANAVPPLLRGIGDVLTGPADPAAVRARLHRVCASPDAATRFAGASLLGQLCENEGDIAAATDAAGRALTAAERLGNDWMIGTATASLAELSSQSGDAATAMRLLDASDAALARFGAAARDQSWLRGVGLVSLGEREAAREVFTPLLTRPDPVDDQLDATSVGWFGLAEIARADGDRAEAAALFERSLGAFTTPQNRASPWYLVAMAALLAATAQDATLPPERLEWWARRLRTRIVAVVRMRPRLFDRPVFGAALVGWSAWALTVSDLRERGVAALALAERMGARQDAPSLHLPAHLARAAALAGPDALSGARAEASALSGDALSARALRVLVPGYALRM